MNRLFKKEKDGWIVYKTFSENNSPPKKWDIKNSKIIKNRIDGNRFNLCSFGINCAVPKWVLSKTQNEVYKLVVPFYAEVCVPYFTDGKVRVSEAKIICKISRKDLEKEIK
jgi:hypothetical protein